MGVWPSPYRHLVMVVVCDRGKDPKGFEEMENTIQPVFKKNWFDFLKKTDKLKHEL